MGRKGMRRHSKVVWPGFSNAPLPRHVFKVGRNDPCPCGSEKKYKDCHESQGSGWLEKLAREHERERLKELRKEMKAKGVPWWKRIFYRV
ncbi:MAG: hypothetical protein GY716_07255 [bacterium]|nr:hypothetical protein [bacterium]